MLPKFKLQKMYKLSSHIEIGNMAFDWVNEVAIESSFKTLTDTCVIKLPRNLNLMGKSIKDLISKGDKVLVKLGYDDNPLLEFEGYVTGVKPNIPLEISCEDEMYKLKTGSLKKSWRNVNLSEVIKYIAPKYETDIYEAELGSFSINNETPAQVLQRIKETYGLYSYFKNNKLICGKVYSLISNKEHAYHFQQNIISHSLEYRKKDELKIKVKAISTTGDNSKIEVEVGDKDGEEHTLNFYKLSKTELEKRAKEELVKLGYDGYKGSFVSFGIPTAKHGDKAVLSDNEYKERTGNYAIFSVKTTFGMSGYRREIEIGQKC